MFRLTRFSLAHPKGTLVVIALVTAVLGVGLTRLQTEFGFRVLLGGNHPSIRTLEQFIHQFGGGLPIQIAWVCGEDQPCETVFDHRSLEMADSVTRSLSAVGGVRRIESPASAKVLVPDTGGFSARRLVENGRPVDDLALLADRALDDPLWVDNLVSKDRRIGIILIQPTDIRNSTDVAIVEAIEEVLAPFEAQGFEYHLVGNPVSAVVAGRDLAASMVRLVPFTVVIIGGVLLVLARSWLHAAIALGSMGIALAWTFGLLGWLGWPRDAILEVLAPLILVVGVCDAIHLLSRYSETIATSNDDRSGTEQVAALREAVNGVASPCLVTTLTTAGALLSFATSELETFVRFGVISAFGVSSCLLLTFSLVPIMARSFPQGPGDAVSASQVWRSFLQGVVRTSERRSVSILVVTFVLFVVCSAGWIAFLRVDTYWYELIGEQSRTVRSIRFLEEHLRPSANLEVQISLPPMESLEEPEALDRVGDFAEFLSEIDGLGAATSVLDLVTRLNRLLHDDDPEYETRGPTAGANAQLIELIGFEDPDLLANWISLDRSRLRISVEAFEQSNSSRERVLAEIEDFVRLRLPADWEVVLTGGLAMNFDWVDDVQETQIRSFPAAFVLVLVLVALFLHSIPLAFGAMVPTLVPVVVTLGAMGWVGMSLDVGRSMIAAILIGVAVDDSIHLLHEYRRRRTSGDSPQESITGAVLHVGRAVVTTSVALSLGFLTLMASAWQTIASFGFFISLSILAALVASLLVLPALIFTFGSRE